MIEARALVDYQQLRSAKVAILVDVSDASRAFALFATHGPGIERLARLFDARILLVEGKRVDPERILEQELADAWLLLVAAGRNRPLTSRNNPQQFNLEAGGDWEPQAFRELLRQVRESTAILEEVAGYSTRVADGRRGAEQEASLPRTRYGNAPLPSKEKASGTAARN